VDWLTLNHEQWSPAHSTHVLHFRNVNDSSLLWYLSGCRIPHITFVHSILKCGIKFMFSGKRALTLLSGGVRSKVKVTGNENVNITHIFIKSVSTYVKPTPKWFTAHSTHIVKYSSPAKTHNISIYFFKYNRFSLIAPLFHLAWHTVVSCCMIAKNCRFSLITFEPPARGKEHDTGLSRGLKKLSAVSLIYSTCNQKQKYIKM